jgi:hypothetical protein
VPQNDRSESPQLGLGWALPGRLAARLRRARVVAAALALYTVLATAMMAPLANKDLPSSGALDIANHVSGIIEARAALAERQFPVRVAPAQLGGERYPIFQFYGNLPYTAGAVLYRCGCKSPYLAWKLVVIAALVVGAFFTFRSALLLTRQVMPALAAGAVFLTAPYLLTDIHGRFAYPEIVSFGLLPFVFWSLLRCFHSPGLGRVLVSAVAWTFLALSHNITYLYGSLLFALFFLSWFSPTRKYIGRMTRLGIGHALGVVLTAWYVAPQMQVLPNLAAGLSQSTQSVWRNAWLTPLAALLSPTVTLPDLLPTPFIDKTRHFGLQVGWPILGAAGIALYLRCAASSSRSRRRSLTRLLAAFALAFFLVWSPFNFWSYLPSLLHYVQFSYRLLMFVVLWGALLSAYSLAGLFKEKMTGAHLGAFVVALGAFVAPCLSNHSRCTKTTLAQELARPDMGRGGACNIYQMAPAYLARTSYCLPGANCAGLLSETGDGIVPAPQAGDTLRIAGIIPDVQHRPVALKVKLNGTLLAAVTLPPGPFQLCFPVRCSHASEPANFRLETDWWLGSALDPPLPAGLGRVAAFVSVLIVDSPRHTGRPHVLAQRMPPAAHRHRPPTYFAQLDRPSLVELPVLYYPPELVQVRMDGRTIPFRNQGAHIMVEAEPGEHLFEVRFTGLRWANVLSLVAWMAIVVGLCLPAVRRFALFPLRRHTALGRVVRVLPGSPSGQAAR